jgi:hypothetical protein
MSEASHEVQGPSSEDKAGQVSAEAKTWRFDGLRASPQAAVDFANLPPAQVAGEAVFSVREDGRTYLFLFR